MITKSFRTLTLLLVAIVAACSGTHATPVPTVPPSPTQSLAASLLPDKCAADTFDSVRLSRRRPLRLPRHRASAPTATPLPTLPTGPLADALGPQLDQILEEQRVLYRVPGQTATILFPDGSRWNGAAGQADIGRDIAVTPDTTFVVGSITKTFVTAAIMQLQEEGVLSIDDPLSDFLPDYPNAENITLAQLMSHTSGLFDYFRHPDYNIRVFNEPDHHWTPQEILDNFVLEPYFAPGEKFKYSNTNFVLLGMVVEAATGEPLPTVLRDRFFDPLSLDDTFDQTAGPPPPGSARGYLLQQNVPEGLDDGTDYRPTLSAATVAFGAGDIVSTSSDLADWVRTVYGGHLLEPESLALMTDYDYSTYSDETYGLGTRTRVLDGHRMFGHTGSLRGFDAAMWFMPDLDTSIAVLTNRGRIEANPIVDALAAAALPYAEAYQAQ